MNPHKINILVLDDEKEIRAEIKEFLSSHNIRVREASAPSEAFRILAKDPVDIAILDIKLPEISGLEVLKEIRRLYPRVQNIMISGHGDMDSVITALRLGAVDYFQKPFLLNEMYQTIEKARKIIAARPANGHQSDDLIHENKIAGISVPLIVASEAMKKAVQQMELVARSKDTTVLITGESGTGKELVAQGIHYLSPRKDKPFHAVNCSTIPDELFESEFFGYKKGAFTGANTDKAGWFEAADGGTLFLDEIGDLKMSLQAKLLRIMEDKQISRLGSTTAKKVDVRIVAATNQDLEQFIKENRFRPDLYHRINTFIIHIPPLRERSESVPVLFKHYLEYFAKKMERPIPEVAPELISALQQYDFPGNIRELKHMVERAMILCDGQTITFEHFDHLKIKMQKPHIPVNPEIQAPYRTLDEVEKESIIRALKEANNNKSQAARLLSISRQALDRKILKLGI